MDPRRPKRPRDLNQLAHQVFLESIGERPKAAEPPAVVVASAVPPEPPKNPNAVALGRLGAAKGGKARASSMTPEQRRELARKAALARWKKRPPADDPGK